MGRGLHADLQARLERDYEQGFCTTPTSPGDARRLNHVRQTGHLVSPAPQLFTQPNRWEKLKPNVRHRFVVRSLARLHPDWVFCHVSAAIIHGLYVSYSLIDHVHVLTDRRANTASNAYVQRHKVTRIESTVVDGVRVTPLARTAFDCMRGCDFRSGLAIADSAATALNQSNDELARALGAFSKSNRGWQRAIDMARFADSRSESGGESVARAVMIEQGYLIPDLQVSVTNPVDNCTYRVDFCWQLDANTRILGELDGREKYRNPQMTGGRDAVAVLADERLRESRASMRGDRIMRFCYADVVNTERFCRILDAYHVPGGYAVPAIARPDDPTNRTCYASSSAALASAEAITASMS